MLCGLRRLPLTVEMWLLRLQSPPQLRRPPSSLRSDNRCIGLIPHQLKRIPALRPPVATLLPLLVLIVKAGPPLNEAVTGEAVFASKMFIQTSAAAENGIEVVAWIAFAVPAPASDAMMKLNGK